MPVHLVPVPKAPVYENHNAILAQHDIRRAGQALHVLTVTVTAREEVTADNPLGFRIPAPYPRHDGRTLFLAFSQAAAYNDTVPLRAERGGRR